MNKARQRKYIRRFEGVSFSEIDPAKAYIVNGLPPGLTAQDVQKGLQEAFKHRNGPPVVLIFGKAVGVDTVSPGEAVLMHVPADYASTPEGLAHFQQTVEHWRTRNNLSEVLLVRQEDGITITRKEPDQQ